MINHIVYDRSQDMLLHTDQEASVRKAAELWVDYDMKRLDEMRALERRSHDFNASRYGSISFRHVVPNASDLHMSQREFDRRLSVLCDQLRAKY